MQQNTEIVQTHLAPLNRVCLCCLKSINIINHSYIASKAYFIFNFFVPVAFVLILICLDISTHKIRLKVHLFYL